MKRIFFLLALLAFVNFSISCVGDNTTTDEKQDSIPEISDIKDDVSRSTLWSYDAVGDSMVSLEILDSLSLNVILDTLNSRYTTANLQIERQSSDTLFLKIGDVTFLEQLGSSGNYGFLSEVVYSLTEVPNVNYIFLDFDEVDHATPGLYTRKDFNNKL